MMVLKIYFLCNWLFHCFSNISMISETQTKTVYLLGIAVGFWGGVFLGNIDALHCNIRYLISWLDYRRMVMWVDMIERDSERFLQRMVTLEKIFAISLEKWFMVSLPLSLSAISVGFSLMLRWPCRFTDSLGVCRAHCNKLELEHLCQ